MFCGRRRSSHSKRSADSNVKCRIRLSSSTAMPRSVAASFELRSLLLPIRIPPIHNFEGNRSPSATCFQLADSFIYRSIASVHASFDLSVSLGTVLVLTRALDGTRRVGFTIESQEHPARLVLPETQAGKGGRRGMIGGSAGSGKMTPPETWQVSLLSNLRAF
ncbi:hypothetical protein MESS4_330181 [Mesorhizobium sp. STM 4661]|nr:hypothetical protein MESS4_330181 [Mesorhizobium sp. STM 4661]